MSNLQIKEKNIAKAKTTQSYFNRIQNYEQQMVLQLLEFPSCVKGIFGIKSKIKNDEIKLTDIVKLLGTHATVTGYYEDNPELKAGHVSMFQRNDIINSLERQERYYLEHKSLPAVAHKILQQDPKEFVSPEQKNFLKQYVEYKNELYNELYFCNFNQEFFKEEIEELKMLIAQWKRIRESSKRIYELINVPMADFRYQVYRKQKNEIGWEQFIENTKCPSKDAAMYLYDEFVRIVRIEKAYHDSFPFPFDTANEILKDIIFLEGKIAFCKDQILRENIGLARKVADDFRKNFVKESSCIEYEDLVQEAIFGLRKAIDKYDSNKNAVFSTYAYKWVTQSIKQSLETMQDSNMKVPAHAQVTYYKIKKYVAECEEDGYTPDTAEIAEYLTRSENRNFTEKQVNNILNARMSTISLNDSDEDRDSLEERLYAGGSRCLEDELEQLSLNKKLDEALKELSPMEEKVIRQVFNLSNSDNTFDMKVKEIALKENLSPQSIRLELQNGLDKLRENLGEDEEFCDTFRPSF